MILPPACVSLRRYILKLLEGSGLVHRRLYIEHRSAETADRTNPDVESLVRKSCLMHPLEGVRLVITIATRLGLDPTFPGGLGDPIPGGAH